MKKRRIAALSCVALSGAALFTFSACFDFGSSSLDSKYPYEIASELGYDGSEASWLASLSGNDGGAEIRAIYDEAVAEGFEGSFLEFLQEYLTVSADDSAAVNRALMSTVSVWCTFSEQVVSGGIWRPGATTQQTTSAGSGVIYSLDKSAGDAYVITNYHVVYNKDSAGTETVSHISDDITLYLYGGEFDGGAIEATYVGGAMDYDLAVLRVEDSEVLKASSAREAVAANSDAVTVGETVYAVGNPEGSGISASSGIVSVDSEYISIASSDETTTLSLREIRTDAAVNHGNSGGGLYNADGKLIGIVNAKTEEDGVEGMGYAIPANLALSVAQNIIDNSAYRGALRATLGITLEVTDSKAVYDDLTGKAYIEESVSVSAVTSAPASGALKTGDVLYSISLNGREQVITRMYMATDLMFGVRKGDTVTFKVYRDGQLVSADITFDRDSYFTLYD